MWYLNFYISKHICNNQDKFADFWAKTYKFITAGGDIIWSKQVGTVILSFENGSELTFFNIAYTPKCDSNFISLSQLQKIGILYHNQLECMILKQEESIIGLDTRRKNLFILDIHTPPGKVMLFKKRGKSIYLLSKNPQIRL